MSGMSGFRQAEYSIIVDVLKAASGRLAGIGGAAERLGLERTALQNKMRKLGITKADYQIVARFARTAAQLYFCELHHSLFVA